MRQYSTAAEMSRVAPATLRNSGSKTHTASEEFKPALEWKTGSNNSCGASSAGKAISAEVAERNPKAVDRNDGSWKILELEGDVADLLTLVFERLSALGSRPLDVAVEAVF